MQARYEIHFDNPSCEEVRLTIICAFCQGQQDVIVDWCAFNEWKRGDKLIQEALPDVPEDVRELMLTSTCRDCFDDLFPPDVLEP